MSEWRSQGKQVLQDGRHFADAAGELEAMMIVNAMKGMDATLKYRGGTVAPPERLPLVGEVSRESVVEQRRYEPTIGDVIASRGASLCRPRREGDEYVCSRGCGVRWDVREPAPRCGRVT